MDKNVLCVILISIIAIYTVEGKGECCIAHHGVDGVVDNDAMWCTDYCCLKNTMYSCCDDYNKRAPSNDRESFCADYFAENAWIVILVLDIGCIVALCFGIYCCIRHCACCRRLRDKFTMASGFSKL